MFANNCDDFLNNHPSLQELTKKYNVQNWDDLIKLARKKRPVMSSNDTKFVRSVVKIVQGCRENPAFLDRCKKCTLPTI